MIEVIIVAVVVLILAAAFIPRFTRDAVVQKKVYTAAHNIASDLRYTRRLAEGGGTTGNSGKNYWMVFLSSPGASSTDTVAVFEAGSQSATITYKSWAEFGNQSAAQAAASKDVLIEVIAPVAPSATNSIYFNERGEPTPAGGLTIEVKDSGDNWIWYVSVARTTGRVFLTEIQ